MKFLSAQRLPHRDMLSVIGPYWASSPNAAQAEALAALWLGIFVDMRRMSACRN